MRRLFKALKSYFYNTVYGYIYNRNLLRQKCKINGRCKFNGKEEFGRNVNFNGCRVYGLGVVHFGDNFHSAPGLRIITSFHNYKGTALPYDHTVITKDVNIENNVWIGMDVIVLGGVTIGEGSIVQAGSVVVKSIPKCSICGGSPAHVFAERDREHYEYLKVNRRFF